MIKEINLKDRTIKYNLQYKKVKNINLRIKSDGTVNVSANKNVPQKIIDDFMNSKADFILRALDKYASIKALPQTQYFSENEVCDIILAICEKLYPHFMKSGIKRPIIKFRRMVSQWGSCHTKKGILTFNTNLMYAPPECIEYVAAHEFTHFLIPNHSDRFYIELSKIMPDWKARRQKLKKISIK